MKLKKYNYNYYNFVNQKWISESKLRKDRNICGGLYDLNDYNNRIIENIISQNSNESINKFKEHYFIRDNKKSDLIIKSYIKKIYDVSSKRELLKLVGSLERMGGKFGFYWSDFMSEDNSKKICLFPSELTLPHHSYRDNTENGKLSKLRIHIKDNLDYLNLPEFENSETFIDNIIYVELMLSRHKDNTSSGKTLISHSNLNLLKDDIFEYMRGINAKEHGEGDLYLSNISYFKEYIYLWGKCSLKTLCDFISWRFINSFSPFASRKLERMNATFNSIVISHKSPSKSRMDKCISLIKLYFPYEIEAQYANRVWSDRKQMYLKDILINVQKAYIQYIIHNTWMTEYSKNNALRKIESMEFIFGNSSLSRFKYNIILNDGCLLEDIFIINSLDNDNTLGCIGGTQSENIMYTYSVNAYYSRRENRLYVPIGICQSPFFCPNSSVASNYGSLGAIIAHEVSHALDSKGRMFDAQGRFIDQWDEDTKYRYSLIELEMIAQYDRYISKKYRANDSYLNGRLTLDENMADLFGVIIALNALKDSVSNINYIQFDTFFKSWARCWRSKIRKEHIDILLTTNPHGDFEFRVNGILQNVNEFYSTYNINKENHLFAPKKISIR